MGRRLVDGEAVRTKGQTMNAFLDGMAVFLTIAVSILVIGAAIWGTVSSVKEKGIRQLVRDETPFLITMIVVLALILFVDWRLG